MAKVIASKSGNGNQGKCPCCGRFVGKNVLEKWDADLMARERVRQGIYDKNVSLLREREALVAERRRLEVRISELEADLRRERGKSVWQRIMGK